MANTHTRFSPSRCHRPTKNPPKKHNKQRPHFRTLRNNDHSKTCKYSEFARILELGGQRKITFEEFENLPVPTRLISPKEKGINESLGHFYPSRDVMNTGMH